MRMSSEALPQSASSKHHQPSIWGPFKMGVQSIISLEATEGKKIENVDTGVDVVDASNADQFIKK
jgi:hypothetical protein